VSTLDPHISLLFLVETLIERKALLGGISFLACFGLKRREKGKKREKKREEVAPFFLSP